MKRIVILISGRGSNMESLIRANLPASIACVLSNNPDAAGVGTARAAGIATAVVDHRAYGERNAFDADLATEIDRHEPHLVLLAGFMRVLTDGFVGRYRGRMLNIHPSLLPAFPGLDTHRRALEAGVRVHGCTVHFVTPALDHGPIVIQAAGPVLAGDTEETLAARVLREEHRVYPQAARWFCEGRLDLGPDDVVRIDGAGMPESALISPAIER